MNVEFIIWIIRQINVAIHAIAGIVCIATFIYNIIGKKGTQNHLKAGSYYKIGTIFLLGTSLVSFLIVKTFPFFLMAYMAYYLSYSSSNRIFENKVIFAIHYIIATFTALFYLSGGKIIGFTKHEYAYIHWGIAFSIILIWDILRLFIAKSTSQKQFMIMHSNRIILSFFFVLTAFMVSQFSQYKPNTVYILCFIIPVSTTTILLIFSNLLIYKSRINV